MYTVDELVVLFGALFSAPGMTPVLLPLVAWAGPEGGGAWSPSKSQVIICFHNHSDTNPHRVQYFLEGGPNGHL